MNGIELSDPFTFASLFGFVIVLYLLHWADSRIVGIHIGQSKEQWRYIMCPGNMFLQSLEKDSPPMESKELQKMLF